MSSSEENLGGYPQRKELSMLPERSKSRKLSTYLMVAIICSLFIGGIIGHSITNFLVSNQINELQTRLSNLDENVSNLQPT